MTSLRIGSRGSQLALWQAERAKATLCAAHADLTVEIIVIKSQGDKKQEQSIAALGSIGVFTRELELALQEKHIDIAVHSLKDLPTESPGDLHIAAVLPRDDPRDALIAPVLAGLDVEDSQLAFSMLPRSATIGTSSLRRRAELLRRRPDLRVIEVRGNVPTRLEKLASGHPEAIVLSYAGLQRLQLSPPGCVLLQPEFMLPAPAQGTIALQTRRDDAAVSERVKTVNHQETKLTTSTERILLRDLEGGCRIPLGALATLQEDTITLRTRILMSDGSALLEHSAQAPLEAHQRLAHEVAEHLRQKGAARMLEQR